MSWLSKWYVSRAAYDVVVTGNRIAQAERNRYRDRQAGYDVLLDLMRSQGIYRVDTATSDDDATKVFTIFKTDGSVQVVGMGSLITEGGWSDDNPHRRY